MAHFPAVCLCVLAVTLGLAGCAEERTAILDGGPDPAADIARQARTACGTTADLSLHLGLILNGTVTVLVFDGDDDAVFHQTYPVDAEESMQRALEGAQGTWSVVLVGEGYSGRYSISLDC